MQPADLRAILHRQPPVLPSPRGQGLGKGPFSRVADTKRRMGNRSSLTITWDES